MDSSITFTNYNAYSQTRKNINLNSLLKFTEHGLELVNLIFSEGLKQHFYFDQPNTKLVQLCEMCKIDEITRIIYLEVLNSAKLQEFCSKKVVHSWMKAFQNYENQLAVLDDVFPKGMNFMFQKYCFTKLFFSFFEVMINVFYVFELESINYRALKDNTKNHLLAGLGAKINNSEIPFLLKSALGTNKIMIADHKGDTKKIHRKFNMMFAEYYDLVKWYTNFDQLGYSFSLKLQDEDNEDLLENQEELGEDGENEISTAENKNIDTSQFKLTIDEISKFSKLFKEQIIGQPNVAKKIEEILINETYSFLNKNHRPISVLFFAGPTGVGKTETVKVLSNLLFKNNKFHRFDMSEYKTEVGIEKLIGAPNGYVGYKEGGTLVNAMKSNPVSIVLFDEIEKADKAVLDLFLQLIDEGFITSNKGEKIYFDQTIIVFTSNIGSNEIALEMEDEEVDQIIRQRITEFFNYEINRPEILGRIGKDNVIIFSPISKKEDLNKIIDLHFKKFFDSQLKENIKYEFAKRPIYNSIIAELDLTKGARDIRNKFDQFIKNLNYAFYENKISPESLRNKTVNFTYKNNKIIDLKITD